MFRPGFLFGVKLVLDLSQSQLKVNSFFFFSPADRTKKNMTSGKEWAGLNPLSGSVCLDLRVFQEFSSSSFPPNGHGQLQGLEIGTEISVD